MTNMVLARRFAIICLSAIFFSLGLLMIVQHHGRSAPVKQFGLNAPCPQPAGAFCSGRI